MSIGGAFTLAKGFRLHRARAIADFPADKTERYVFVLVDDRMVGVKSAP